MGSCSDAALVSYYIRRVLAASSFQGEGYRKVWAKLLFEGIHTSKERMRRLMRQIGLQAQQQVGHPHSSKAHGGTIITKTPDEIWEMDRTTTLTRGKEQANAFVGVDHCTFECTGIFTSASGNRFEAMEPIQQGGREHWAAYTRNIAAGFKVCQDHGR